MKLLITTFFLLLVSVCFGCDFCGCYMGITPYDNQSSFSILYRYKSYNGYYFTDQHHSLFPKSYTTATSHSKPLTTAQSNMQKHGGTTGPTATPKTQDDFETFSSVELHSKYFIHKRIELAGILPLVMNKTKVNDETSQVSSIGDITFIASYHLISKIMEEKFQHRLILGAGIKLPVGDYYAKSEDGDRIDFLNQAGTGSIDYLINLNYVFGYHKIGYSLNSTYKFNGINYYGEQISNSTTNYLNVFFKFREDKKLKIFPSLQGYYEYSKGLRILGVVQPETTMNIGTAGLGLDLFYKNFSLNTSFQLPIYEQKFDTNMGQACKLMVGLTFSFNQKKYLFNSKENS